MEEWQRVADALVARRTELGQTMQAIANAARVSRTTLYQLEKARQSVYEPVTLRAVEHALGWTQGSIDRILRGGQPTLQRDPDFAALEAAWERLTPGYRRMLRMLATEAAQGTFS